MNIIKDFFLSSPFIPVAFGVAMIYIHFIINVLRAFDRNKSSEDVIYLLISPIIITLPVATFVAFILPSLLS